MLPLVSYLTSTLLLHEPDNPVEFLIDKIEKIINFREHKGKPPILFNNNHLANVFKGIDFINSGTIDMEQYFKGEFYSHIIFNLL